TPLEEITPELSKAILYKEDKYFYYHPGVNPLAICRAVYSNIKSRKRISGASTITMQVARMMAPKKRTYVNKLIEIFRAFQLEWHFSKKEILQLYLNMVPYGSNIQGVKAAALLYFGKSQDQLSLAEITTLSLIPNDPNSMVIGRDNLRILKERNRWLKKFEKAQLFENEFIQDALNEPLTAQRKSAPKEAPQLALRLRRAHPSHLDIVSSLDAQMQMKAEEITQNYSRALQLIHINNAAVIVIDNFSHEVRAYIGSPFFLIKKIMARLMACAG